MNGLAIRNAVAPVFFLAFVGGLIALTHCSCTPAEQNAVILNAENAAAVKQYDDELVGCQQAARQRPKEQRFEAYVDCEQAVSKRLCGESQELREHWSRCKELDR